MVGMASMMVQPWHKPMSVFLCKREPMWQWKRQELFLMRDRLLDVVEVIELSRATFNKIRQNLFWAFGYNILGIPAACGCFYLLWHYPQSCCCWSA
jgi:hypothetical protein